MTALRVFFRGLLGLPSVDGRPVTPPVSPPEDQPLRMWRQLDLDRL